MNRDGWGKGRKNGDRKEGEEGRGGKRGRPLALGPLIAQSTQCPKSKPTLFCNIF